METIYFLLLIIASIASAAFIFRTATFIRDKINTENHLHSPKDQVAIKRRTNAVRFNTRSTVAPNIGPETNKERNYVDWFMAREHHSPVNTQPVRKKSTVMNAAFLTYDLEDSKRAANY
jgi:hypothetical protein